MRSSDDESPGPVIRDRRRIDPVTGRVRGASQPADQRQAAQQGRPGSGRHSASRPGGQAAGGAGREEPDGGTAAPDQGEAQDGGGQAGSGQPGSGQANGQADGGQPADAAAVAAARLAERTADLQRLQAEYANYRKRVERDRMAVREQALANVLSELLPVLDDIGRAREHGELTGGFKSVADSLEAAVAKLGLTTYGESGEPFDPNVHEALMHSYSADVSEPSCVQILQPGYRVGDRILRPARVAVAEPGSPDGESATAEGEAAEQAGQDRDGEAGQSEAKD
ncbi:MAG TPA: nucleotide exchange factor GrpE [Streptosporangiaceae bacterium]